MAIFPMDDVPVTEGVSQYPAPYNLGRGHLFTRRITEAGGLTQFGAALEILMPGGQSSQMHWEDREDEFLYMLSGTVTVVEDGVETLIGPGDACCWKAGAAVAHCLRNDGDRPATYLIVGTRDAANVCHYPGLDLLGTPQGYTHLDGTPYPERKGA